jgi:hypothetical protein
MRCIALLLFFAVPGFVQATEPGQTSQPIPISTSTPTPTSTPKPALPFTVSAKRVAFYSDLFALGADGNVLVILGDGTRITGNTFEMHLKLNRFVIAGNVHVHTKDGQDIPGAAFAEFFDFDRAYFVPIVPGTESPDRWTIINDDFARPLRGREMPGDAFSLPDFTTEHVFLYGSKALIVPRESVRFTPAFINLNFVANKAPIYVPSPSYFFTFSANPNFAQNGLAGAYFDAPYPFAGGPHGLAAAHLRYDEINKAYLSYEQHLAITDRSYVVFSANPITRPQKSYNLLAMDHLSPQVQTQLFVQENAFQHDFSRPLAASAFSQFKTTIGLRRSFVQINEDESWQSLLANPAPLTYYGDHNHAWIPDHGSDGQISWTSFDNHVYQHTPLMLRLRSGMGFVHDSYNFPASFGGVNYPTIWQHFAGGTLYTPALHLKNPPFRNWYFNAILDKQRQWYSSPHFTDTTSTSLSLSKTFDKHVSAFVSYSILNTGDFYGAQQSLAYPSQVPISPITGQSYPGYAAFNGFQTSRSLAETVIWSPSNAVTLNVTWRENHDFPDPIPYLTAPLGFLQTLTATEQPDIGVSPQQLTADLRLRLRPNLLIDLGRSNYFNWGNRRWSPQFTILISK